ncbi:hypothetical protein TNCV_1051821 [Trichonephila clavipes]|nr:hypothetical protein TNCV_1051821 [Trichonephila clavipes]
MTDSRAMDTTEGLIILSDSKSAAIINGGTNITSSINFLLQQTHYKGISFVLLWTPAHVNIEKNERADSLAKEARYHGNLVCATITFADVNDVARSRHLPHSFKKPFIIDFDSSQES